MKKMIFAMTLLVGILVMSAFVMPKKILYDNIDGRIPVRLAMILPDGFIAQNNNLIDNKIVSEFNGREVNIDISKITFCIDDDTIDVVMDKELNDFKAFASEFYEVHNKGIIVVDEGKNVAIIKHILGSSDASYIASAYIPERDFILNVNMTTDYYQAFHELLPKFNTMVRSYRLLKEPGLAANNPSQSKNISETN
jgi:hypothetical protein